MKKRLMVVIFGIPSIVSLFFFVYIFAVSSVKELPYADQMLFFNSLSIFSLITLTIYYILKDRGGDARKYLVFLISIMLIVPLLTALVNLYIFVAHISDFLSPLNKNLFESGTSWVMSNIIMAIIAALIGGGIVEIIYKKIK